MIKDRGQEEEERRKKEERGKRKEERRKRKEEKSTDFITTRKPSFCPSNGEHGGPVR